MWKELGFPEPQSQPPRFLLSCSNFCSQFSEDSIPCFLTAAWIARQVPSFCTGIIRFPGREPTRWSVCAVPLSCSSGLEFAHS